MTDVATLAADAVHNVAQAAPAEQAVSMAVRRLFILMHGSYGNLFLSKFSTGEKDAQGKDKGIRAAMKVWESKLSAYSDEVIETAAGRMSPDFPPNLPQFDALCQAAAPRQTYAQEQGLPQLPAPVAAPPLAVSFDLKNDGRDWARRILARAEAGEIIRQYTLSSARIAMGLEGKQSWQ